MTRTMSASGREGVLAGNAVSSIGLNDVKTAIGRLRVPSTVRLWALAQHIQIVAEHPRLGD